MNGLVQKPNGSTVKFDILHWPRVLRVVYCVIHKHVINRGIILLIDFFQFKMGDLQSDV